MKDSKNKKVLFIVLAIISFIIVIFSSLTKQFQNDTFYSIKIGQYILSNGIDMLDHYSWISNLPYTYPHWLFDVIVGITYNLFSFNGLYILTFILYMLVGVSIYFCLSKLYNNKILAYFLMIISIVIIRHFATLRAQIITYSLIIWFYYYLVKLINTNNKKYIILMIIDSVLIANLHSAIWPFILILFLPYIVEYIIYKLKNKIKILNKLNVKYNNINIKLLILTFILILLSGLIVPNKLTAYTYLINTMRGVSQQYIGEHQPIVLFPHKLLIIYILFLIIVIKNKKLYLSDIFLLLGLSIMMLSSNRHASLFIILSIFLFNKYLDKDFIKTLENKLFNFFTNYIGMTCVFVFVWYILLYINIGKIKEPYISNNSFYPIYATKYIKDNLDYKNIRLYNSYNVGSYLLYNDIKVMFDSRADLYTKEFNKKYEYLEEFMNIDKNYKDIFRKYNITHALVYKDSKLDIYLSYNKQYKEIYDDLEYVLYEYVGEKL